MKILVTGGGSEEPIDNVRAICNFSTGRTSAFLADLFAEQGNEVTEIAAQKAIKPKNAKVLTYRTFAQLAEVLEKECRCGNYDLIVHAAAVSDFSPTVILVDGKEYAVGEFSKVPAGTDLVIKMRKNPKLVDSLKLWAGTGSFVVAFKLTSNATDDEREAAVNKIFAANVQKGLDLVPDFVVSNDLSEITQTAHPCKIYDKTGKIVKTVQNMQELGFGILDLVK